MLRRLLDKREQEITGESVGVNLHANTSEFRSKTPLSLIG